MNDVTITTSYLFRTGPQIQGSNSWTYSMSGTGAIGQLLIVSGNVTPVNFGTLTTAKYLFIDNQSLSGNLTLSLNSGMTQIFSVLGAGESLTMPITGTGIYWSGSYPSGAPPLTIQLCANVA